MAWNNVGEADMTIVKVGEAAPRCHDGRLIRAFVPIMRREAILQGPDGPRLDGDPWLW
jgi:hypothetical protein